MATTPRLLERYRKEIIPAMMEHMKYTNALQVPKLEKVVLNVGLGEATQDIKFLEVALLLQLILGLVIGLGLGFKYTPQVAFGIVATGLVVIVVVVYIVANIACIGYYAKHRKEERHPIIHIVVPAVGALFLVPGFLNAAGITGIPGLGFIVSLSAPLSYAAYFMAAWMAVGVISLIVLQKKNPKAIAAVADIHV